MTDDRLERELRSFLLTRAPTGASEVLRQRLAAVSADAARPARWRSRSIDVWRGVAGLAATIALAVLAVLVLSRLGDATVRDGEDVGRPSVAPVSTGAPFVDAPSGFFTAAAIADAQERLGRVFAQTGVEATLIVSPANRLDELSTPDGWPEGYDRDADGRRDVTAVAGVTPNDSIVCCLTITGATIDAARQRGHWRPIDMPSALDDELAGATAEDRDAALTAFVSGIEDLATAVTELGVGPQPDDAIRAVVPVVLMVALAALVFVAVPWPQRAIGGQATAAVHVGGARRWRGIAWPSATGRRWLLIALVAVAAVAIGSLVDVLRAPDPTVAVDPRQETVGIARPAMPFATVVLVTAAAAALAVFALRGGKRRRVGIAALALVIFGSAGLAVDTTRPSGRDVDISWASSPNGTPTSRGVDGVREVVTYDVSPGETFSIAGVVRNSGVLPLTILGLDGTRATRANPHVASIVGMGWVPQPVEDGRVHLLSAHPESASAAWPLTLGPGEEAAILLVGRAGPCAEPGGSGSVVPLSRFGMTYRVLGIERAEEVPLPADLVVPAMTTCTVEVPGGSVTYGPTN
jgi:hypothetical protein